jgi:hypothetical protein
MKFQNTVAALATVGLAAAHGHGHAHAHKRAAETETVSVPGPVVYDFVVLDPSKSGRPQPISSDDGSGRCWGGRGSRCGSRRGCGRAGAARWTSSSNSRGKPFKLMVCETLTSFIAADGLGTPTTTATVAPAILQEASAVITPASSSSTVGLTSSFTSTVEHTSSSTSTVEHASRSISPSGKSAVRPVAPELLELEELLVAAAVVVVELEACSTVLVELEACSTVLVL